MTSKDTTKLTNHSLNVLSKLIDSDTQVSTIDLNLLENLNTNQSLNYIKLENNLNQIEKNSDLLKGINDEYERYRKFIDDIDRESKILDDLVNELDAWSKEIEKKVG
ncbi:hypothetical protein CLIB1444_05S08196 [[Candida] jaroonii]|uniref:Uncharacterized protein n=1 Tax=[Candida] jaroonii TaxID=467808 RepID=A0ACA9Y8G2_9ASCO|nr:hypothetical protein CLIB1444_05S08196 [[Candida] jaroonii]